MPLASVREECGVFAIQNHSDAVRKCLMGLHALQHRGQESFGVAVSSEAGEFAAYHSGGYVNSVLERQQTILPHGTIAVGHVRYSTSGSKPVAQPVIANCKFGKLALAHNGNLTNALSLRRKLIDKGCVFSSDVDTEVIAHLIAASPSDTFIDCVIQAVREVKGAYSLVIMTDNILIGVRDAAGIRPLTLGMVDGAYVIASETCALDIVKAKFTRDIQPGELVAINRSNELTSVYPFPQLKRSFCIFEYIYFSRPDSVVEGIPVYEVRKNIGAELAVESPPPDGVDMVVPVPDSGVPAALGYARKSGIPFEFGIARNHYVGRTFIQPTDGGRRMGVELKHNANSSILRDKSIVLVDDSIVRGTTLQEVIELLRKAGTKSIHLRVSSPPTLHSCFYGIDTPEKSKLAANRLSMAELNEMLQCDSIAFISIDGLYKAVCGAPRNNLLPQYCDACFTGTYPVGEMEN
ncbi:amidophosphoribosyltransferase [Anaplasma capra]|uniref:amidophosphoribosyltransferase n=1 Tax=Anaplasma capra TaxID=1562740 RepID=UPI0021D5AB75|nr:amidophosphoribosyltransferase [Anaplasma capra]MCU7611218.1 amidophosphoribosyltransferase [Anaplasma capra]MCU7612278.1 amidophosphoribosyltransferase [Anaplasma capra]